MNFLQKKKKKKAEGGPSPALSALRYKLHSLRVLRLFLVMEDKM